MSTIEFGIDQDALILAREQAFLKFKKDLYNKLMDIAKEDVNAVVNSVCEKIKVTAEAGWRDMNMEHRLNLTWLIKGDKEE